MTRLLRPASRRHGLSSSEMVVILVLGALVAVGAFMFGRMSADSAETTSGGSTSGAVAAGNSKTTGNSSDADEARAINARTLNAGARTITRAAVGEAGPGGVEGDVPWSFEPEIADFGLIPVGVEVLGSFEIRNTRDTPLRILAMKASCKCTTLEDLAGYDIAPGETVTISARVEAKEYPSDSDSSIKFVFEGFEKKPAEVVLKTVFTHPVQAIPHFIQMENADEGRVRIRSIDNAPFRILGAGGRPPVYVDGFDPASGEKRMDYTIAWDFREYDTDTCYNDAGERMPMWWAIETDHPGSPIVDVRVRHYPCTMLDIPGRGKGKRHWFTSENRVILGIVEPEMAVTFELYMEWLPKEIKDDVFDIVESLDPRVFSARMVKRWTDRQGRERCQIEITVKPDVVGLVYGEIRVHSVKRHSQRMVVIGRVAPGELDT